jgi:hypothetical protein
MGRDSQERLLNSTRKEMDEPVMSSESVYDAEDEGDERVVLAEERRPLLPRQVSAISVMGTVRLTDGGIVYIPTATADPRGTKARPHHQVPG